MQNRAVNMMNGTGGINVKRNKNKRIAREIIMYWVCEAWHDLDNDYYKERLRLTASRNI